MKCNIAMLSGGELHCQHGHLSRLALADDIASLLSPIPESRDLVKFKP